MANKKHNSGICVKSRYLRTFPRRVVMTWKIMSRCKSAVFFIIMVVGCLHIIAMSYSLIKKKAMFNIEDTYSIFPYDVNVTETSEPLVRPYLRFQTQADRTSVTGPHNGSPLRLLRGHHRNKRGYLTIGMCTVPRKGITYLYETLSSLISKLKPEEHNEVVIVLFLGSTDSDWEWENQTLSHLDSEYIKEISEGLLHVVRPPAYIYPDYGKISKRTFNDSFERVKWRTKQNIDYAYLFDYSSNISTYYMHIEDDVLTATGFLADVKSFVDSKSNIDWYCLEFCRLGFIGKLFHSEELWRIKEYMLLFKTQKPGDVLLRDLMSTMLQSKSIVASKSLFQHIGTTSSLTNKTQKLKDNRFKDRVKNKSKLRQTYTFQKENSGSHNPAAEVTTTISEYAQFPARCGYLKNKPCFFWGKDLKIGQIYQIKFTRPETVKSILVKTGHPTLKTDKLKNGEVKISNDLDDHCGHLVNIGTFNDGLFSSIMSTPKTIRCVVIEVTQDQPEWLIINDIEIKTVAKK